MSKVTQTVSGVEQTVAEYSYDNSHNVTNVTNNIGTEIKCEYNDAGQVTKQTTIVKDESGKETTMTESFTYYQNGNYLKGYTDASDITTLYVYDDDPLGENITKGLVTSVTNPNGNVTTYIYDPNTDELISTSGAADTSVSSTTSFTYENYLPKTITRNGTTYSYEYDSQNRVTSSKVGNQILATNSYDDRHRLSQVTYANGGAYAPVYDSHDRLIGDYWNGTRISDYNYNENDRLSKFVDNVTDTSYQYDYAFYGLPFKVTGTDGTKSSYDYDRSGTLSRLTFSDDNDIIYSGKYYTNEKGMPEDVVIDTLDNAMMHYNYDDFGRIESYSYGPVIRTFKYKDGSTNNIATTNGQVIEIVDETQDGIVLQVYDLDYHIDGSLYYAFENVEQDYYDYFYDELGRVMENYANGDLYDYYYDAGGNLTEVTYNTLPLHTYTYGNANWKDQLTAFDSKAITYDANGNPLTYDGYTYTWQRGTQLANISGNGKNISYVYDAQGHRVQKTVNGLTTNYLYSGDLLMRQTDGTNTIDFQYDAGGNLVGFLYNGAPYYYLRNLLNDISGIVDSDGNIVAKYRYDAYGNAILATGTMAEINPIRYRGYYFDTETNWYYLESRYYNPEWCRFISPDSLFVAGDVITGSNMYAYCNGNPVSYVDPSGNASESSFLKTAAGNLLWLNAKVRSIAWLPASWALEAATDEVFAMADPKNGSFAEIGLVEKAIPVVKEEFTDQALPNVFSKALEKFPFINGTFDVPTGLRYVVPMDMEGLLPWAEYFLGFKEQEYGNYMNYTSQTGLSMWQSAAGYSPIYDFFFSVGGPIFKDKYPFVKTTPNGNKYYVVWIWKADYWNLGAGAEIGIYSTDNYDNFVQEFYEVDTELRLYVDMTVKYRYLGLFKRTLNHFEQENWWVCSFTPEVQLPNLNWLSVDLKVKFKDESLMNPFYLKKEGLDGDENEWNEISWTDFTNTPRAAGHELHRCGCEHPALCVCKDIYSCCSSPCMYYTENGNEFSGYQFNINY